MTQRYAFALVVLFMLSLVFAFGAPPVFAQGFNFPNFGSTTNLTLNPSAAQSGNVLRLTPASGGQVGSAWYNTQQVVSSGFTTTFQFRFTSPSDNGPADGIALVIQNGCFSNETCGASAIDPTAGGGIGYGGLTNSLAVEFDTFRNTPNNDPNANHVAVQSCGAAANSPVHNSQFDTVNPGCLLAITNSDQTLPTLADGNVHTVAINYDANSSACDVGPGLLSVYLDSNIPVVTACVDLATFLGLEGGTAFVGFTSATEAATEAQAAHFENHDILNWSFSSHSGQTTNVILNFTPGTNVSQVATYNCPSNTTPCTDPEAHSLKLTASEVDQPFSLVVSATTVDGTGRCESGDPNNAAYDCRYVNHFGIPGTSPEVTVPLCYPYVKEFVVDRDCVYYRVENPPDPSKYKGPIYWYIAWNDDSFVTSGACAAVTNPVNITYQCGNPQMADDPSDPPHTDANQFTRYITTYFNSSGGQVGFDPGLGGGTKNFNDVAVVFPPVGQSLSFALMPPLTPNGPNVFTQGDTIPVKFRLTQGNIQITNAATPPNTVGIAILDGLGVRQPVGPAGFSPTFSLHGNHYQLNTPTSQLVPGTYQLLINSNLFPQQTVNFTIVP